MLPFFLFGGGPTYWIVLLLTLAITGGAAMHVRSTYRRWAGVRNSSGMTGAQMARTLQLTRQYSINWPMGRQNLATIANNYT